MAKGIIFAENQKLFYKTIMQKIFFIAIGVIFILEFYVYQAFRTIAPRPVFRWLYGAINVIIYAVIIYNILKFNPTERSSQSIHLLSTLFLAFLLPKVIIALFLLVDDISRLVQWGVATYTSNEATYPSRRKFLSFAGFGVAGLLSVLLLDGVIFGKYRQKVRKVRLKIKNLPQAFKGYKIIQLSDVHSGSFQDPKKLQHAIDLINEQNADLVLFTGDMVNNYAEEFRPFIPLFGQIKAKDGKFSVLGNHDYGAYGRWQSSEEQRQNVPNLIAYQKEAGFQMLRNEHIGIQRDNETLYIVGVENWGLPPFPQYGDLDKATAGIPQNAAKILMSHDPTHFDEVVKKHPADIALTLSGHTHGMQFGLDLKNIKWSPVQYRYSKWADLYESEGKYLYVNRGFGVLAYSGRVGVLPEITLFELE